MLQKQCKILFEENFEIMNLMDAYSFPMESKVYWHSIAIAIEFFECSI